MKICPSALGKAIVTVLADTPVGEVLSRERTDLIARTYGSRRHSVAICALKTSRLMFSISLTVHAKKETRNRYFLVDSFPDRCEAILWNEKQTVNMIEVAKCKKIPKRNFLSRFRGSGFHYQDAYSSWLITELQPYV